MTNQTSQDKNPNRVKGGEKAAETRQAHGKQTPVEKKEVQFNKKS